VKTIAVTLLSGNDLMYERIPEGVILMTPARAGAESSTC
jgi:hypothetical protein